MIFAVGLYLMSTSWTCTALGMTVEHEPVPVECLLVYWDVNDERVWRLCALVDLTGVCLVDAYPGTVLMGVFE